MRILVVEDYGDVRELLTAIFSGLGCEVDSTADLLAAIELLVSNQYDLVTIDTNLREGNPFGLVKLARGRKCRVVVITTDPANKCLLCQADELGVERIFGKPFAIAELRQHILGK